ncbi:ABC transporter substrate-binding protein [Bradyrhizobium sp. SZCCHNPS2010]|uniref:ABC transporter substrate-binding protein n=1 Tax=Bradyrhizobium sp. SZCCHNPS2010 TaxID=3057333 RepID=UPI002916B27E|nr:ABC transporter substrate-binding protein [Bradyrhizobium sp. SZCCHNPS2010]
MKKAISMGRRKSLVAAAVLAMGCATAAVAEGAKPVLLVGFQDQTLPETVAASKVLEGAPYEVQWVTLTGPAAQLSALYSKAIDIGHMGDTSLIIEQGKAKEDWTAANVPLQIVAGWRTADKKYPPIVTVVRTGTGVETLADAKGHSWSHNYGGYNYLQYVLSLVKAELTEKDIEAVRMQDTTTSAAAFNSGKVDIFSGSTLGVIDAMEAGKAKILVNSDELDIPALNVFTARGDVLRDPAKKAQIADFLARLRAYWAWYPDHKAEIEAIFVEKLKQAPQRAKYVTAFQQSSFVAFDDALIAREQRIAEVLLKSGVIPKTIDVAVEFNRDFNAAAVAQR